MKKILILILSLIMLVGCSNLNDNKQEKIKHEEKQQKKEINKIDKEDEKQNKFNDDIEQDIKLFIKDLYTSQHIDEFENKEIINEDLKEKISTYIDRNNSDKVRIDNIELYKHTDTDEYLYTVDIADEFNDDEVIYQRHISKAIIKDNKISDIKSISITDLTKQEFIN